MYLVNCNMDCLKHEMSKLKVDLSFGLSHLYNPGQANLQFSHFDTQILCGIKFGNFRIMKQQFGPFWRSRILIFGENSSIESI